MRQLLTVFAGGFQRLMFLGVLGLLGCSGGKSDFIGNRVLDPCNGDWPVCNTVVGCILGPESYTSGTLPISSGFIVQLGEPSTVRLHFYLDNATAAGVQTVLNFNETGCRARITDNIPGQDFVTESQSQGEVYRDADLADIGDHLIQFNSDARANYLVKVDIISKRTQ